MPPASMIAGILSLALTSNTASIHRFKKKKSKMEQVRAHPQEIYDEALVLTWPFFWDFISLSRPRSTLAGLPFLLTQSTCATLTG